MSQRMEMEAALEAVLFVSPEPVPRRRLLDLFTEDEQEDAQAALEAVLARYGVGEEAAVDGRGVMVEEVAGGIRLVTRPEMNDWLRRFFESGAARKLSMGALETLAIVAYRQPVTAPEIQELRSVNPAGVLKTLLERRLVRIAGRKEVVGKPFLYATTQDFLLHFGLRGLKDLPPLEEFEEALAGEGLGELLGGTDDEEDVLREAARLDENEEESLERAEREQVDDERAAAEAEDTAETETAGAERDEGAATAEDGDEEAATEDEALEPQEVPSGE
ncbi:MAG: SMC-Scp complex subunit ScpB [Acidobacteria bacterium]|nr:SMC-Scp complex subunit ScpB [Acidobacteriota bacterium]